MSSIQTPEWVRDAVFYQIFPDRFAHSEKVAKPSNIEPWDSPPTVHGFKGGDLLGIAEHLDYLQDLGITALYLNPIFQSTANHRYHTFDYYCVDPILGGNEALRTLIDEAHRRGIRIILDGVFNHASRGFFQFNHIAENGAASPYVDWFVVKQFPLRPYQAPQGQQGYEAWWDQPALPKLNTATPAVREFLWDVAVHWIELGIDGWRLDVPLEIKDDEFWREFRRRVRAANPEAYIVAEIWHDAQYYVQGDQFDAVMNYMVARACLGFFAAGSLWQSEAARTGYHWIDPLDAQHFRSEIERLLGLYAREVTEVQYNLLGSHDTPRFKTLARGDATALKLATLFEMTYPGAPSIYYGDEIGLEGRADPGCRGSFPWDEGAWDRDLRTYIQRCIALRKAHPALRRGEFQWLLADQGILAYGRRLDAESWVVVLNANREPATFDLPVAGYLDDGAGLKDAWADATYAVAEGKVRALRIGAREGLVLQV